MNRARKQDIYTYINQNEIYTKGIKILWEAGY